MEAGKLLSTVLAPTTVNIHGAALATVPLDGPWFIAEHDVAIPFSAAAKEPIAIGLE
jgi:hypothetical protein